MGRGWSCKVTEGLGLGARGGGKGVSVDAERRQPPPAEEWRCVFPSGAHTRGPVEQSMEKEDGSWRGMADTAQPDPKQPLAHFSVLPLTERPEGLQQGCLLGLGGAHT